ncbi:hypothetical protein BHECKSOX_648 [Bathymodiolus heckerae thiotrophic gill symbiont]|nr:hypothetical protein BHECKSOX_648 [Bathymodiolus heckerae thiotrophic gill symbiont]
MLEIEYEFGDRDLVHYNELQIDQSGFMGSANLIFSVDR